jgi:hypothetical protein
MTSAEGKQATRVDETDSTVVRTFIAYGGCAIYGSHVQCRLHLELISELSILPTERGAQARNMQWGKKCRKFHYSRSTLLPAGVLMVTQSRAHTPCGDFFLCSTPRAQDPTGQKPQTANFAHSPTQRAGLET